MGKGHSYGLGAVTSEDKEIQWGSSRCRSQERPALLHTLPQTFCVTEKHCLFLLIAVLKCIPTWLISSLSFRLSQTSVLAGSAKTGLLLDKTFLRCHYAITHLHLSIWLLLPYELQQLDPFNKIGSLKFYQSETNTLPDSHSNCCTYRSASTQLHMQIYLLKTQRTTVYANPINRYSDCSHKRE